MTVSLKTTKMLWGRAASRCAICREKVVEISPSGSGTVVGEAAHIVAEKKHGPRGVSLLSDDERDEYANLILLCRKHHKVIDDNPNDYPIEVLHRLKTNHEFYVDEAFAEVDIVKNAADQLYASIIDAAERYCRLSNWCGWTSGPLNARSRWRMSTIEGIREFRDMVLRAPWSGTRPDLEAAIRRFAYCLAMAETLLGQDADELKDEVYEATQSYRAFRGTPQFDVELRDYRRRIASIHEWIIEATKAGNWFCDIVRADINPFYLLDSGKLAISAGLVEVSGDDNGVPEFTSDEKAQVMLTHTGPPSLFLLDEPSIPD